MVLDSVLSVCLFVLELCFALQTYVLRHILNLTHLFLCIDIQQLELWLLWFMVLVPLIGPRSVQISSSGYKPSLPTLKTQTVANSGSYNYTCLWMRTREKYSIKLQLTNYEIITYLWLFTVRTCICVSRGGTRNKIQHRVLAPQLSSTGLYLTWN